MEDDCNVVVTITEAGRSEDHRHMQASAIKEDDVMIRHLSRQRRSIRVHTFSSRQYYACSFYCIPSNMADCTLRVSQVSKLLKESSHSHICQLTIPIFCNSWFGFLSK